MIYRILLLLGVNLIVTASQAQIDTLDGGPIHRIVEQMPYLNKN